MHRKILIVGDSGRGKSTFAQNISHKTGIPFCSTDDFYWKVKFSQPNDKQASINDIAKVYAQDAWIVDGSTRHLILNGIEKADMIYLLEFNSILPQYYSLIMRHLKRDNERLKDIWELLVHITRKRFKKGYRSHLPSLNDLLKPHEAKVKRLTSFKQIQRALGEYETI